MSALIADPILNVMVADLMDRGVARDIGIWTDEEAELARLAAFWPYVDGFRQGSAYVRSNIVRTTASDAPFGTGRWWWFSGGASAHVIERFRLAYDSADSALHVALDEIQRRVLGRGRRLPPKFRRNGKPTARVLPWTELRPPTRDAKVAR